MILSSRYQAAIKVTLVNASTNTLLALLKIVVGYFGHSQALIADGVHSFADLVTDTLVLIAARIGDRLPDKDHPYGHRRIETIAAIIISFVLILVALSIAYDTVQHVVHYTVKKPDIFVILVAVFSIIANEGLFRYTLKQGNRIHSELLRTDAWHNRSDVLVSTIVLLSVLGTRFGITYLDSIGALIIAILILKMGLQMTWSSLKELIDTGANKETLTKIMQTIQEVPGVISVHQLRTRSHGGSIFVDVHIQVNPDISVSEGHFIGEQVHIRLVNQCDHIADVTVHIDPEDDETSMPSVHLPDRKKLESLLKTRWKTLPGFVQIRRTTLHYLDGKLRVEIYLPASLAQETEAQHRLEQAYREAVRDVKGISTVTVYYE
ncbi:MAG: cation diffusion facilitator family transporter [Coxiella sp. RIFCSPHIGHO2_12_FULL_44_14]|nr:MAG: cation diffusion facilitator family transporter [Coxiella sp. RIFCSPHIGHO2_12_FULL_44_14]